MNFVIFAVLTTICTSQEIAANDRTKKKPSKELMDAYYEMGDIGRCITLNFMETYFRENNQKVKSCCETYEGKYDKFTKRLASQISEAADKFAPKLGGKHKDNRLLAQDHLRRMAKNLKEFPPKIKTSIKSHNFTKVAEIMKDYRVRFEYNFVLFIAMKKRIKKDLPKVTEKTENKIDEIFEEAHKNSNSIIEVIRKCIDNSVPSVAPEPPEGFELWAVDLWSL